MVRENLIVGVEISFALDENRAGGRVKIIHGADHTEGKGLLKAEKRGRRYRNAPITEAVEEVDEHAFSRSHYGWILPLILR